jgi:RNA polymerase sigma-70 factor, ECF subfamily
MEVANGRLEILRSDKELVGLTLAGDRPAFTELVQRHEGTMHALAFTILRDRHAAEDAVQDAFVAAYRALPDLRQRHTFGSWMAAIVRHRAQNAAAHRQTTLPVENLAELAAPAAPTGAGIDRERLLAGLTRLPEKERIVLMLRHFDGHDMQSIARILGQSVGTVTKRISRGHARLRHWLQEDVP